MIESLNEFQEDQKRQRCVGYLSAEETYLLTFLAGTPQLEVVVSRIFDTEDTWAT